MSLFNVGKKQEEQLPCACQCGSGAAETVEVSNVGKGDDGNCICCIKVLGSGCASFHALYENAKDAFKLVAYA